MRCLRTPKHIPVPLLPCAIKNIEHDAAAEPEAHIYIHLGSSREGICDNAMIFTQRFAYPFFGKLLRIQRTRSHLHAKQDDDLEFLPQFQQRSEFYVLDVIWRTLPLLMSQYGSCDFIYITRPYGLRIVD